MPAIKICFYHLLTHLDGLVTFGWGISVRNPVSQHSVLMWMIHSLYSGNQLVSRIKTIFTRSRIIIFETIIKDEMDSIKFHTYTVNIPFLNNSPIKSIKMIYKNVLFKLFYLFLHSFYSRISSFFQPKARWAENCFRKKLKY